MTVEASSSKCAHPPRLNRPRSSSSGPPGPCITPSTETCTVVVSFMVAAPFSLSLSSFDSTGPRRRSHPSQQRPPGRLFRDQQLVRIAELHELVQYAREVYAR